MGTSKPSEQNFIALRPQQAGDVVVAADDAGLRIDDEDHHVRLADGQLRLRARLRHDIVDVAGIDAARIDDGEPPSEPLDRRIEAIASHAGGFLDDGEAAAEQSIEQRRLTHVGTPNEGDDRGRTHGR